jgi:hypothetical protein
MNIQKQRIPFLILAASSLIVGLIAGLARIGWNALAFPAITHHGSIMVGGFLGTLIILEKIIPMKKQWLYLFPVLSGLSVLAFILNEPQISFLLLIVAGTGLSVVFLLYLIRERSMIYVLMLLGSICWTIGNVLVAEREFYPMAVSWWMAFTLFIISAERIELMKFLPVTKNQKYIFTSILLVYIIACLQPFHGPGNMVGGAAMIAAALWLLRFDLVGITLFKTGLTRFVAVSLLCGYISLLFTGVFLISFTDQAFAYDITVHTFFIGFVFSMIFAHGPIILPGVIGISIKPYHPLLYCWLFILHASWIVRTFAGALIDLEWRRFSGVLSAIAIPAYLLTIVVITYHSYSKSARVKTATSSLKSAAPTEH